MYWTFGTIGGRGREMYKTIWLRSLKEINNLEDLVLDGRIIVKWTSREKFVRVWTVLIWRGVGRRGRLL